MKHFKVGVVVFGVLAPLLLCASARDLSWAEPPQVPGEAAPVSVEARQEDPLPSWRDGQAKRAVLDFVSGVVDPRSPSFVPRPERIAVLDGAGTMACERPVPSPDAFTADVIRALVEDSEDWASVAPLRRFLALEEGQLAAADPAIALEAHAAACAGLTSDDYTALVETWLTTIHHERFARLPLGLIYQPMIELMLFLRANGFEVWFSSSGDQDFLRCVTQDFYDIPPAQVIGSTCRKRLETREGRGVLVREASLETVNVGPNKVISLEERIGRVPILAAGNSDEDLELLRWTDDGVGAALVLVVQHDDAEREYAYLDGAGRLSREARDRGWQVVSFQKDFDSVFPTTE